MTLQDTLLIQPLNAEHHRQGFYCGNASLDAYIQKQARLDVKRRIARVFVATTFADERHILGYYSLSSLSIFLDELPKEQAQKLPKHPLPAALIGRLAVAKTVQSQGIGRQLLANVLARTLTVSDEIGIHALVVDALDEQAQTFYEKFGFLRLTTQSARRLWLPLKSV